MEPYAWPPETERAETLDAFVAAFASLGYFPWPDGEPEPGWEKAALFADTNGVPTHAARQLTTGAWTSKLGRLEDIEHRDPEAVEGSPYGRIARFLRRPLR